MCFYFFFAAYGILHGVFFFQAEDGIRDGHVTGVQTCALPILTDIRPVLFVIDDLHWATPESVEMVRALNHDTEGLSMLILVTARPVAVEPDVVTARELRRLEAESRLVMLGSLNKEDVAKALAATSGRGQTEQ